MMSESLFPEKRSTRSQVTLPDNILQVTDASPMKLARTALKNQRGSSSRTPVSDSEGEDELLLSPNKKGKHRRKQSRSKRTASPPPQDEYASGSKSPLEGRELKRAKRDSSPAGDPSDTLADLPQIPDHLKLQSNTPGHSRPNSESNAPAVRRSNRKRAATINKPPPSAASASPPRVLTTPPPTPGKGRAQSVPIFSTCAELPRVDFRKLPASPKRARSRSPSKEREVLRIVPAPSLRPPRLSTIEDNETTLDMDVDEASSVPEEIELPHIDPATMQVEPPSLPSVKLPDETAPQTPRAPPTLLPQNVIPVIPFTPATQSLNKLIPLSPLTPLPETPWVGRVSDIKHAAGLEGRIAWALPESIQEESPTTPGTTDKPTESETDPAPTSKSRLPRPPMAPPAPQPSKLRQTSTMPLHSRHQASTSKTPVVAPPRKNAFDFLMGRKPQPDKNMKVVPKGKAVAPSSSKPAVHPPIFSSLKGKEKAVAVETGPKITLKSKMKARSNTRDEKLVITVDEEEQDNLELESMGSCEEKILGEGNKPSSLESGGGQKTEVAEEDKEMNFVQDNEQVSPEDEASQPKEKIPPQQRVGTPPVLEQDPVEEPIQPTAIADGLESNADVSPEEGRKNETSANEAPHMAETSNSVADVAEVSTEQPAESLPNESATVTMEAQQPTAEPEAAPAQSEGASNPSQAKVLPKVSKLPLGKKRVPSAPSVPSRVTRSISKQKDAPELRPPVQKVSIAPKSKASTSKPPPPNAAKRKPIVSTKKLDKAPEKSTPEDSAPLPPGSPMKVTTPGKSLRLAKSVERLAARSTSPTRPSVAKTPVNSKFLPKAPSTPSPAKIARATTALTSKPSVSSITRTFSMGVGSTSSNAGSTLSTLSNALEKLRMPAPSRPNTSMGFTRTTTEEEDVGEGPSATQDDGAGATSLGLGRTESIIQRPATIGSNLFKPTIASSNKVAAATTIGKNMVQKPLTMFMGKGAAGTAMKFGVGGKPPLFANAPRRLISKKTSLPTLIGSPVKGGKSPMAEEEDVSMADDSSHPEQEQGDVSMSAASESDSSMVLDDSFSGKGKAPASRSMLPPSSRIMSVSHALSESLSALPRDTQPAKGGVMGPPATPPKKRGAVAPSVSSGSPSTGGGVPTRSSSRIAKSHPAQPEAGPSTKKDTTQAAPSKESLKILNECVIFVDVKTDDGEEAGSLFVEMLEGMGAKLLTRVGQSCTHIVYKNGLSSTFTRYKLLRDPKPLVVGIGWVVECVEKRKHVEEKNFLVDLDTMNATTNSKRRRSILPKLLSGGPSGQGAETDREEEGDISMDGSTSSITIDDHIAPLEKARRRQSFLPSRP